MEHLQYPIGRFSAKPQYSAEEINQLMQLMKTAPDRYMELTSNLSETDLAKTYREGSWTVRQLVHHVADIHLLNFLRVKKTLTEENYEATLIEIGAWVSLSDTALAPVSGSLNMLAGISERFAFLINSLTEEQFKKSYYHAARQIHFSLHQAIYLSVWHLEHHIAHIELALGLPVYAFNFRADQG